MCMRISITYPSVQGNSHGNAKLRSSCSMQYHVGQPHEGETDVKRVERQRCRSCQSILGQDGSVGDQLPFFDSSVLPI
ncbi:unnamed protein product [Fusarium graminearum]|uniref:Uncharacterized protein n=1 Tax=Gibberella zeae TaxID=5518 RepID=A0A4E9EAP2_GIBZA|nr:unnamed protein product [Fusarium graminearum]CAF3633957.1 unnamed protein product [Fusarium graminearum]CAG1973279.1 unnamed protein product [Fusarium graminearum]CAG1986699.1 unnamed protein product [Fusarium graminearum]